MRSADLAGVQVGEKDMTKGAFAVWQDLLQKKVQGAWGSGALRATRSMAGLCCPGLVGQTLHAVLEQGQRAESRHCSM